MKLKPFDIEEAKKNPERVVTRDGRKVRILTFDAENHHPIVALVTLDNGTEAVLQKNKEGMFYNRVDEGDAYIGSDLMLMPVKIEKWGRIFERDGGKTYLGSFIFDSEAEANNTLSSNFLRAVKIEWEE